MKSTKEKENEREDKKESEEDKKIFKNEENSGIQISLINPMMQFGKKWTNTFTINICSQNLTLTLKLKSNYLNIKNQTASNLIQLQLQYK
jgi:hypothetical protein